MGTVFTYYLPLPLPIPTLPMLPQFSPKFMIFCSPVIHRDIGVCI